MNGKKDISELKAVVNMLANGETLPPKYKDHILKGQYLNRRQQALTRLFFLQKYTT